MEYLSLDGKKVAVSPQWAACVSKALGVLQFSTIRTKHGPDLAERLALLELSNTRRLMGKWAHGHLENGIWVADGFQVEPGSEYDRLQHLTHVRNVANTLAVVGAHHNPIGEWGFDGWCAVHGNSLWWSCLCRTHYVFDHHSAVNHFGHDRVSRERNHFIIEPLEMCWAHRHHNDPEAHYRALLADHASASGVADTTHSDSIAHQ